MQKRVYIAGPITGIDNYKDRFRRAEILLEQSGYQPVSPVGEESGYTYRDYINRGLSKLATCDAICMLPGWMGSRGAKLEKWYAETVKLPVMFIDSKYARVKDLPL